jgi:hypothetical protein
MGHKIRDKVPSARLVEIEGAGHCLPSEVPLRCAQIIETTELLLEENRLEELVPVTLYGDPPLQDVTEPALPLAPHPAHGPRQTAVVAGP